MNSDPPLFEHFAEKIRREIELRGGLTRKGFAAALEDSAVKAKLSRRFLLGPIRERVGLDRLRYGLCCGAPLTKETFAVLEAVGIPIQTIAGFDMEGLVSGAKRAML